GTALGDEGLVVPVLRNAEKLGLVEISQEIKRLVEGARSGSLALSEYKGATFTISNHGVSGSLLAMPIIINQPESAILGIGKVEKRPTVVSDTHGDSVVPLPKAYITLTIDHRVLDGFQANKFLDVLVTKLKSY